MKKDTIMHNPAEKQNGKKQTSTSICICFTMLEYEN